MAPIGLTDNQAPPVKDTALALTVTGAAEDTVRLWLVGSVDPVETLKFTVPGLMVNAPPLDPLPTVS